MTQPTLEELTVTVQQMSDHVKHLTLMVNQLYNALQIAAITPSLPNDPRRTETGMGPMLSPDKSDFV